VVPTYEKLREEWWELYKERCTGCSCVDGCILGVGERGRKDPMKD
jgi:hypothetical protein